MIAAVKLMDRYENKASGEHVCTLKHTHTHHRTHRHTHTHQHTHTHTPRHTHTHTHTHSPLAWQGMSTTFSISALMCLSGSFTNIGCSAERDTKINRGTGASESERAAK